jgi:hypothetical protein
MRLPFATNSYTHRSLPLSAQRMINVYVEPQPQDAKARLPILPAPGLRSFATLAAGPCRGLHVMGTDLFAVAGDRVFRVRVDGVVTNLGAIPAGGEVSLDSNGDKLAIVVPETAECYVVDRATGSITLVTDADFDGAASVCVIDGYFIFGKPNTGEFFLSAINDPLSFNALDFATAEGSPDNLLTVARVGRDLWLFGERSTEIWSNTGATDFPFQREAGGYIARGTAARFSVASRLGGPLWLGDDRVAYTASGTVPQRLSTSAIEQAWAGYTRVDDAVGWVVELEGAAFYVLTFPTAGDTWVCNLTAGASWHERESEGLGIWRATRGVPFGGGVIAGDTVTGDLWRVDPTYALEGTEQIVRTATGTTFHAEARKVFMSRFAAEFSAGQGLVTGQGSDPTAWLSWSDDGGHTFGEQIAAPLGKIGEYRRLVEWRRLGSARERVFRLQWSDPIYTTIAAVNVEAEAGSD